ncbi:hypothetical protein Ddc_11865 [Ditylenchus destructor]|nr:hypothetical protein Ddc_11865 [Ditylenchus destructor]
MAYGSKRVLPKVTFDSKVLEKKLQEMSIETKGISSGYPANPSCVIGLVTDLSHFFVLPIVANGLWKQTSIAAGHFGLQSLGTVGTEGGLPPPALRTWRATAERDATERGHHFEDLLGTKGQSWVVNI